MASSSVAVPLDVITQRLMVQDGILGKKLNTLQIVSNTLKNEGFRGKKNIKNKIKILKN